MYTFCTAVQYKKYWVSSVIRKEELENKVRSNKPVKARWKRELNLIETFPWWHRVQRDAPLTRLDAAARDPQSSFKYSNRFLVRAAELWLDYFKPEHQFRRNINRRGDAANVRRRSASRTEANHFAPNFPVFKKNPLLHLPVIFNVAECSHLVVVSEVKEKRKKKKRKDFYCSTRVSWWK